MAASKQTVEAVVDKTFAWAVKNGIKTKEVEDLCERLTTIPGSGSFRYTTAMLLKEVRRRLALERAM